MSKKPSRSARPSNTFKHSALAPLIALALSACGGGGGGGAPVPPPLLPAPVISTENQDLSCPTGQSGKISQTRSVSTLGSEVTNGDWNTVSSTCVVSAASSARIASLALAQSHVLLSTDSALVLIVGKPALLVVNVTTSDTAQAKPAGKVRVETAAGVLVQSISLTLPTQSLAATVPDAPSFATAYSAVLPANLVQPGMKLTVSLENGQTPTAFSPRVGGGIAMTVVAVPVQMSAATGEVLANAGADLQALMPLQTITYKTRAAFLSKTALPTTEPGWSTAMNSVLDEMAELYILEGSKANTSYYGFLPKRTYGQTGLGYMPGNSGVGWDMPSAPSLVLNTMVHELGHNLNLPHAPCGGPVNASYPYIGGYLGAPGRYIWGYNFKTSTFTDPRDTTKHDVMSYCTGTNFSDYNYRLMQTFLTPADKNVVVAEAPSVKRVTAAFVGPQPLLVISGNVGAGKEKLKPVKSMFGDVQPLKPGPYTLKIASEKGDFSYSFAALSVDHNEASQPFIFTIPDPGKIFSITVSKGEAQLIQSASTSSTTAGSVSTAAAFAPPQVSIVENAGVLFLSWDGARYPYLSITHVGAERSSLGYDLPGGRAQLASTQLPSGGSFELSLSDGLNTVLLKVAR